MLSGKARLAGLMGWPVGHSLSPRLHGYWLDKYGIDGAYVPLPVRPEDAVGAIKALPMLGFLGCNVTVPHKEAALAAVDEPDTAARRIGAVNTIIVGADRRLRGSNTDGFGFLENVRAAAPGWRAGDGPAVVLGAGGSSRAVCVALVDAGVPELCLVNRNLERARRVAAQLGGPVRPMSWAERGVALRQATLLVNTTTLGMSGQPPLEIDLAALPSGAVVTDIVYTPLETGLLRAARARGNLVVDGLGMLLHQARPGFAAWFGQQPEVTDDLRAFVLAALEA
jgi:shikimate dehydrogenase